MVAVDDVPIILRRNVRMVLYYVLYFFETRILRVRRRNVTTLDAYRRFSNDN